MRLLRAGEPIPSSAFRIVPLVSQSSCGLESFFVPELAGECPFPLSRLDGRDLGRGEEQLRWQRLPAEEAQLASAAENRALAGGAKVSHLVLVAESLRHPRQTGTGKSPGAVLTPRHHPRGRSPT